MKFEEGPLWLLQTIQAREILTQHNNPERSNEWRALWARITSGESDR
jgi:hypothetical protein